MSFANIEKKWQDRWERAGLGEAEPIRGKKKFFMIFAFLIGVILGLIGLFTLNPILIALSVIIIILAMKFETRAL